MLKARAGQAKEELQDNTLQLSSIEEDIMKIEALLQVNTALSVDAHQFTLPCEDIVLTPHFWRIAEVFPALHRWNRRGMRQP